MKKFIKLNIGCGETKLKGYINIDTEKKTKPDLLLDIKASQLPFEDKSVTQINCTHNIEHIEIKYWPFVLSEFHRVLKLGGQLILSYPEFERCAKNFIENYRGSRAFWRATLYGRQLYPGDYHVTPMVTSEVISILKSIGFDSFQYGPEEGEPHNTFMICIRGEKSLTREDVIRKEIFKK